MKIKVLSVLKTSETEFDCFEDSSVVYACGSTLCIKELGSTQCEFIGLGPKMTKLFAFKTAVDFKSILTAEMTIDGLRVSNYGLDKDRTVINISDGEDGLSGECIESVELLTDSNDASLVYGSIRCKNDTSCVFVVDFAKKKVGAIGFLPHFPDIKVNQTGKANLTVCGNTVSANANANPNGSNPSTSNPSGNINESNSVVFVKHFRASNGYWQVQQRQYKKLHNISISQHEYLPNGKLLLASKNSLFIVQQSQILQQLIVSQTDDTIAHLVRIPRGVLVGLNHEIKVYLQGEEQTLQYYGHANIELHPGASIAAVRLNTRSEDVVVKTTRNEFHVWRNEPLTLSNQEKSRANFVKMDSPPWDPSEGTVSISTGQKYCLLVGGNIVTLWNVESNDCVLTCSFTGDQQMADSKCILSSAIHPDGNSLLLAFEDRIRLYKILLTKFKLSFEFPIRRCQNIVYSHDGHLAACRYGRGSNSSVVILNLLRLTEMCVIKLQAEPLQMLWNTLDDELIISTENHCVQAYKAADNSRLYLLRLAHRINFIRIDQATRMLLVSMEGGKVAVVNTLGQLVATRYPQIPQCYSVFPLHGTYLATTLDGCLHWSSSLDFENKHSLALFHDGPFSLLYQERHLVASRSFQSILLLQCHIANHVPLPAVDEQLVLIERDEVNGFFEKIKLLESNLEALQVGIKSKIQEQKRRYERALTCSTTMFKEEIKFLQHKYTAIAKEKMKQEKESDSRFNELQAGQKHSVVELEKMYERKLRLQRQKCMALEQQQLEQKMKYEGVICNLEDKYHKDIAEVRQHYLKAINEESRKVEDNKKISLEYKKNIEIRMIDVEEENQVTLFDMQRNKDELIAQLRNRISQLEEECDRSNINLFNQTTVLQEINQLQKLQEMDHSKLCLKLNQSMNRIKALEEEVQHQKRMIEERNRTIDQQSLQIGGLEKAKYVLSFRTAEIRKELQPKESLIHKLKTELFKLDEEFKQEKTKSYLTSQRIQKMEKIFSIAKKQNNDLRLALRNKERAHNELCYEIFSMVNTQDQKEWPSVLIKIYQRYVKELENRLKSKDVKQKDETSQEINRHLIHVEQSLMHVSTGNEKIIKGKEKDVIRKMKENSELVFDLNLMRKRENEYLIDIKEKDTEISRLRREINGLSTRSQTANTGITCRVAPSRDLFSQDRMLHVGDNDLRDYGKGESNSRDSGTRETVTRDSVRKQGQSRRIIQGRSRVESANKTMMWREEKSERSSRLTSIVRELQCARSTIKRQDQMIEELNQRLMGFPDERAN